MKRIATALLAACAPAAAALILVATPVVASAQTRAGPVRSAPIQSLDETKDLIKAFRSIDGRVSSGINYRDMTREMGDLTIAVKAFDEVLEARKDTKLRQQLAQVMEPYIDAKTIWDICMLSDACSFDILVVGGDGQLPKYIRQVLERYPSLNTHRDQGGVFDETLGTNRIFRARLIGALWDIAGKRAKALRGALQR